MTESQTTTTEYRGYSIVSDEVAADIWHGENWVSQESNLDLAKKTINQWMEAR